MKKELSRHKIAYTILFLGLSVVTILFLASWPNRVWQRGLAISLALFYFLWGVVTHTKADHITRRVVLEYFGVSVLAALMLVLVTL